MSTPDSTVAPRSAVLHEKACTKCACVKSAREFYRQRGKRSGLQSACKECVKAARLARYHADPERQHHRDRAYYRANCERAKATNRRWRVDNPEKVRAATRAWRRANPEKTRSMRLKATVGVSAATYDELLRRQDGRCAVCRMPETVTDPRIDDVRNLAVDHDHACCAGKSCGACIRGLLCARCNTALGLLRDEAETLDAAARYLRRGPIHIDKEAAA